jgi:hypothetical protein
MVEGPAWFVPTKSQAYTGNVHLHLWLLWYKGGRGEVLPVIDVDICSYSTSAKQ